MTFNTASFRLAFVAGAVALGAVTGCQEQAELGKTAQLAVAADIREALLRDGQGGESAAESTSTGWGTLKGRFVYEGDPPAMPPYQVNKDQATCAPGGQAPLQQFLLVDPQTKGIANVALYVRRAPRVHESAQPRTEPVIFDQKVCVFLTHVTALTVGQTLDIRNSDPVGHNTNISGQNKFNQIIPSGGSTQLVINEEEATPQAVSCSIHPWMLAYLLPRENGYFAVTAADGSFEIPNLPAGEELEFQVWHERAAGANGALVVDTPQAEELDWSDRGRFSITLKPDETREVNITVPASAFSG